MLHLKWLIKEAIKHKGFSFIDVLQPCVTFFNTYQFYGERCYKLEEVGHNPSNFEEALEKACEWDYNSEDSKIPIGIFYRVEKVIYEERI
jgi:2-oxoglutarate ferredoxin oxidoreductase subunit beta